MSEKCEDCERGQMKNVDTCEDYLIMECDSCESRDLKYFGDLDDEEWKWVIQCFRKGKK